MNIKIWRSLWITKLSVHALWLRLHYCPCVYRICLCILPTPLNHSRNFVRSAEDNVLWFCRKSHKVHDVRSFTPDQMGWRISRYELNEHHLIQHGTVRMANELARLRRKMHSIPQCWLTAMARTSVKERVEMSLTFHIPTSSIYKYFLPVQCPSISVPTCSISMEAAFSLECRSLRR